MPKSDMLSLFFIASAAVLAPLLAAATHKRIPDVVWLLILGVVIGPSGCGIAEVSHSIDLFREVGMGMLFLIAGTEINVSQVRAKPGRVAIGVWLVCCAVATGVAYAVVPPTKFASSIALGIALTSTALGTLLPILIEEKLIGQPMGNAVLIHGAIGELAPVLAMSILLSSRDPGLSTVILLIFVITTAVAIVVPTRFILRHPAMGRVILMGSQTPSKTLMRVVIFILTGLMALSSVLDLDIVLGAFTAGIIVRALAPVNFTLVEKELRTLGFSFLIPIFFVTSGMTISLDAVIKQPWMLLFFVAAILVARGVPVMIAERTIGSVQRMGWSDSARLGLYAASGLPIIVAVTEVAVAGKIMPSDIGSLLVAAGGASVLLFPLLAHLLGQRATRPKA
ncbi:cation:proton antiporter [Schaalia sp. ZJ405]|uniref:cation:proton antiporter n=1 Tax=Schaalia sp. ZJ405 TaxID=2709403 RepID=UPI001E5026ED|nr:cation:proton antiporter [Schaalia sp. ZJ405]